MRTPDDVYDEWLVLRCQSGNSDALATLVQRWQPRLLRFAARLMNEASEAEDIVQTSWVAVIRKIQSVDDPGALRAWLFRIVANKCADAIRRRTVRQSKEATLATERIADDKPAGQASADSKADVLHRLRAAMRDLDDGRRQILRLHYLEGLSIEQIAKKLSVPEGTVKSRLFHARRMLRETLEDKNNE